METGPVHVKGPAKDFRLAGSLLLVAAAAATLVALLDSSGLVFRYQGGRPRDVGYGWLAHLIALAFGADFSTRLPAVFSRYYELREWRQFLEFQAAAMPLNVVLAWIVTLPAALLAGRRGRSVFSWRPSALLALWLGLVSPAVLHLACEMSMVGLWLYDYASRLTTGAAVLAVVWLALLWPLSRVSALDRISRTLAVVIVAAGVIAVVAGIGLSVRLQTASAALHPGSRPNILLVSIDTLRADHVSSYGYARQTSPNLDALASEGVRFETALAPTSWTLPSHVTMLTGLPPHQHRVAADLTRLRDEAVTLAEVLRSEGYATAAFVSGPYLRAEYGHRQGFDLYDDYSAMPLAELSHREITSPKLLEEVTAWLEDWDDDGREHPFFVFLHMWDVHYDFNPPSPYDTMFDPDYAGTISGENFESSRAINRDMDPRDLEHVKALYDGEIRYTDHYLGRLFEFLRQRGVFDSSIVAVTADHGEEFFEHGSKGHRRTLYDEVLHVPLIMRYPQRIPAGRVIPNQVRLLDVAPTLLGLAGVEPPPSFGMTSGEESDIAHDLYPLITGAADAFPPLLAYGHQDWYLASVRSQDWKLIVRLDGDPRPELYDLRADPGEQQNLSDQQGERLDNLYSRVTTFRRTGAEKAMVEAMEVDREHLEALRSLGYITTYWDTLTRVEAELISPAPGSTLESDTAIFQWGAEDEVDQYYLKVGSAIDSGDVYESDQGKKTSATVSGLPTDGRKIFVRLLWKTGEDWHHEDFHLKAGGDAELLSPAPGAALPGPQVTFRWSPGIGLDEYALKVGTTPEGEDIHAKSWGLDTAATVPGIPADGRPIFVKLLWRRGDRWSWRDYEYRAAAGAP